MRKPNQTLYRSFAPLYDGLFGLPYASARRRTTQLLKLQPGEHLFISGVGTGLDLGDIPPGVDVVGIDISSQMLQQASLKATQASNLQLIQMDAQCLELQSASFDAVLLNLIVSVAPDGNAVFREAWRVLKPNGRLVLFDKFAPEGHAISLLRRLLGGFFRLVGTDVNRKLSDILGPLEDGEIELNEPSLFFGQYRILKIWKKTS